MIHFNQGNLIDKLTNSPSYHVIGHLTQVIQLKKCNVDQLLHAASPRVEESLMPNTTVSKSFLYSIFAKLQWIVSCHMLVAVGTRSCLG